MDSDYEQRLYVINRAGTGHAHYLLLTPDTTAIASRHVYTECWESITNVTNFGVAVADNALYIIGGFDRTTAKYLRRMLRFDPEDGSWIERNGMSLARAKFAACVVDGMIFVIGGEREGGIPTASCEMYDTHKDIWTKAGMLPTPRASPACTSLGTTLYCAGGLYEGQGCNNFWIGEDHCWRELDEHCPQKLPRHLERMTVTSVDNTIYFIGGVLTNTTDVRPSFYTYYGTFAFKANVTMYNMDENSHLISPWILNIPCLNSPRHSAGHVVLGSKIYLIGGTNLETGREINQVEYYDISENIWERDFRFRKENISNVVCSILQMPSQPAMATCKASAKMPDLPHQWIFW